MNKQEKRAYDNLVQKHTEDTEKLVKIRELARIIYSPKSDNCKCRYSLIKILEIIGG